MKTRRILFGGTFSLATVLALPCLAAQLLGTYSDWEAFTERENGARICYIGSEPTKARGNYTKRGQTFVLVTHRPAEKSTNVFSIRAGYTYKKNSEVTVDIGTASFKLFTDGGHAFAYDSKADGDLVKAMVRGSVMTVKGTSSRGTPTTDTYSLKGFTKAYKTIGGACKV